jgi:uncharacterized protein (TIRG00374 family)
LGVFLYFVKIAISFFLLLSIFHKFDYTHLLIQISKIPWYLSWISLVILGINIAFSAKRWQMVMLIRHPENKFCIKEIIRTNLIAFSFSQSLPSSLGGDFYKVLMMKKAGIDPKKALFTVIIDRMLGFLTTAIFLFLNLWHYKFFFHEHGYISPFNFYFLVEIGIIVVALVIFAVGFWCPFFLKDNKNYLCKIILSWNQLWTNRKTKGYKLFLCSITNTFLFFLFFVSINWCLGYQHCFLAMNHLCTIGTLMLSIPISLGGWGFREEIHLSLAPLIGLDSNQAITVSIAVGLYQLLMAFIGIMVYLFYHHWQKRKVEIVV